SVWAGLNQRSHFVPGFVHFAAVNSFDRQLIEDDDVPVDRGRAGHNTEQRDFAAVKQVRKDVVECFWAAGHFERDVETFFHVEFLHRVGQVFGAHVQGKIDIHLACKIESIRIDVGDDDVTRAGVFADRNRHAADRAGAGDEHVFTDEIDYHDKLMANGHRHGDRFLRPGVPVIYMYVGAADGCLEDANEDVVTCNFWNRNLLEPQSRLRFRLYDGLHRFLHGVSLSA